MPALTFPSPKQDVGLVFPVAACALISQDANFMHTEETFNRGVQLFMAVCACVPHPTPLTPLLQGLFTALTTKAERIHHDLYKFPCFDEGVFH